LLSFNKSSPIHAIPDAAIVASSPARAKDRERVHEISAARLRRNNWLDIEGQRGIGLALFIKVVLSFSDPTKVLIFAKKTAASKREARTIGEETWPPFRRSLHGIPCYWRGNFKKSRNKAKR